MARIFAQGKDVDVYSKVQPIGEVLNTILDEYVRDPDVDKVVEGALVGMMNSLDKHSSFISADVLKQMKDETRGEFEGIGVHITLDEQKNIVVAQPLADSPAAKSGVMAGDIIAKIDGVSTSGMALEEASKRIKGPRGEEVRLTLYRRHEDAEPEILELAIKRGPIPLESIKEARILQNGIGYIRISDFKDNTARDLAKNISKLQDQGMASLVLDLRWNPGGLLTASKEVSELFLPKNTLVTYTEGRKVGRSDMTQDMKFYTDR
ncbi:MAG: S41 family peptidase, partial [Candidatus Hydrogenedentes bacterium]|nr:S41 family peptidase [Candidatus Hydrogenedentota bacterium]